MTETDPFEDRELYGTGDLARFLGGSETSFTGQLLLLLQKADPGNVARIRAGFPGIVEAWETWKVMSPCPTPRQLQEALTGAQVRKARSDLAAEDETGAHLSVLAEETWLEYARQENGEDAPS